MTAEINKTKKRVIAYIDGFNLYHSLHNLGRPHLKWVNLWTLLDSITRGDEKLDAVKYFSAYATWKPKAYFHHRQYVNALEYFGVTTIMGNFKGKPRECTKCKHQWDEHEEKETDVNLALRILCDAVDDSFDRAIIVSADSDLLPIVKEIKSRFPQKEIFIATPPKRHEIARDLCSYGGNMNLTPGRIERHLLPDRIKLDEIRLVIKPPQYKKKKSVS
ncbi:NYN domain-containing protein [Candidatus Gracilibacteria bacterium]|nr:NYN domain-containing protein [Candidatus Gracilibacteria bacterium]